MADKLTSPDHGYESSRVVSPPSGRKRNKTMCGSGASNEFVHNFPVKEQSYPRLESSVTSSKHPDKNIQIPAESGTQQIETIVIKHELDENPDDLGKFRGDFAKLVRQLHPRGLPQNQDSRVYSDSKYIIGKYYTRMQVRFFAL